MRTLVALVAAVVLLSPIAGYAQDGRATLESVAKAMVMADNITRLNMNVDTLLPLHGRLVPLAALHTAIGRPQ